MDIDWEWRKQGCWIALEAYHILHRINTVSGTGTGTGRITRTRTRLHGKPKLKIHRGTPGTICAKMQGLYRASYAI